MKRSLLSSMFLAVVMTALGASYSLLSPDGQLRLDCAVARDGQFTFSVAQHGTTVVAPTAPTMTLGDGQVLGQKMKVKKWVQ